MTMPIDPMGVPVLPPRGFVVSKTAPEKTSTTEPAVSDDPELRLVECGTCGTQRREIDEKLEMLARMPEEDTYTHGATVRIVVRSRIQMTKTHTYLLLKIVDTTQRPTRHYVDDPDERWYFTGYLVQRGGSQKNVNARQWLTWDELTSWIANDVVLEMWDVLEPRCERDHAERYR